MDHSLHQPIQYTCPMHPEIILDGPGKCPKCGMNLVPVKKATDNTVTEMKPLMKHDHAASDQMLSMNNPKSGIKEYTCPMHPEIVSMLQAVARSAGLILFQESLKKIMKKRLLHTSRCLSGFGLLLPLRYRSS